MERKFKGIALMLVGIFILIIACCGLILQLQFELFIAGLFVSFCLVVVGLYFVFSEQNNDIDKAVDNLVKGKDE